MKKPTQCCLWNKKVVNPEDLNFESVQVYTKEPNLKRELFRCRTCGQNYFHEWYEHVNFNHDSYMYDTFIPVDTPEDIHALLATKSSAELIKFRPQLHGSLTNGGEDAMRWILEEDEV